MLYKILKGEDKAIISKNNDICYDKTGNPTTNKKEWNVSVKCPKNKKGNKEVKKIKL